MSVPELDEFLSRTGLVPRHVARQLTPLTGGVSSDIWRVDVADGRTLCVKRALAKLKVAADWQAPVSRNAFEWAWIQFARGVVPQAVPEPLAHDESIGMFAMGYLDPVSHPVWKQQLLAGIVDVELSAAVGRIVGQLHQASAHRADVAQRFDTGANFHALRLEPYLVATSVRHPDLALQLQALVECTAQHRAALVHGDVSPKNILAGPRGPVLLDAECAWYGDPAFDVAFCLNHLLLKRWIVPDCTPALRAAFEAWVQGYFESVDFEPREQLEARCAHLLPALMLARVDGKSPVEYITTEQARDQVRAVAIPWVIHPPQRLSDISRTC
jgi:5-methylthioribose kinase